MKERILKFYTKTNNGKIYNYIILNKFDDVISSVNVKADSSLIVIRELYTQPVYRNLGYAEELIIDIMKDFNNNFDIYLIINKENEEGYSLFSKFGFETDSEIDSKSEWLIKKQKGYYDRE